MVHRMACFCPFCLVLGLNRNLLTCQAAISSYLQGFLHTPSAFCDPYTLYKRMLSGMLG